MAVLFLSATVLSVDVMAQKVKAPVMKHDNGQVSGVVALVKGKDGKIAEVSLTTKEGVLYRVTMNDAAKNLEAKDGQTVSLSGFVEEMDGAKWFTISAEKKGRADGQPKKGKNRNK